MEVPNRHDNFNDESEKDKYDNDDTTYNGKDDEMFYNDGDQFLVIPKTQAPKEDDWSNPQSFDEHLDDECDYPTCNKDAGGHDISKNQCQIHLLRAKLNLLTALFSVTCQDIDIEDMPTFDVYSSTMFCFSGHEPNTKGIIKYFDLSFIQDGCNEIHNFEDPLDEVYSSRSHPTLLHHFIMHYWIKTHWANSMGVGHGLCKQTNFNGEDL